MKKFWIEIAALFLFVIFLFVCVELFYAGYPTQTEIRLESRQKNDLIFIGNSHMGVFGETGFTESRASKNLSFTGMTIGNMKTLLNQYATVDTKFVIIGLDYDLFFRDVNMALEYEFVPYIEMTNITTLKDRIFSRSAFLRAGRDVKWFYMSRDRIAGIHKNDFIPARKFNLNERNCKLRAEMFSNAYIDQKIVDRNQIFLDSIFLNLKSRNIKVAIINTPKRDCYKNYYSEIYRLKGKSLLDKIHQQYKVPVYDFYDSNIPDSLFADYDHLNQQGVRMIIDKIAATLPDSILKKI